MLIGGTWYGNISTRAVGYNVTRSRRIQYYNKKDSVWKNSTNKSSFFVRVRMIDKKVVDCRIVNTAQHKMVCNYLYLLERINNN
jgi:hypothetical protein